jgi:capsular polysaccharide biosynthesis protein
MRHLFPVSDMANGLLYISRARCRNAPVGGETAFQDALRGRGFEVVNPEDLSIREQAQKYDRASAIVAIEGSALHTLLLAASPKTVVILRRRRELDINFRLQFCMQPQLRVKELGCMKRYAHDFGDDSELDVDAALSAVEKVLVP